MIPKIKRIKNNKYPYNQGTYMVIGDYGIDIVDTYLDAIRYWLWHCGVPAKYCFKKMENQITEAFELGVKHASENAYKWLVNNLDKYVLVLGSKIIISRDFKEQLYNAMIND